MRSLPLILAVAALLLAAPQIEIVYDFGGVVVNKTCYLAKTPEVIAPKVKALMEIDRAAKMLPSVKAFVEDLKKMPGVYIRGDEILSEEALRRLKDSGEDRVNLSLEVYIFGNKSLIDYVVRRAKGLEVGMTIFYINAKAPEYPGRKKMIEVTLEWAKKYVKAYGNRSLLLGFELDMPLIVLGVINATEEEADKVAAQMRGIVPCEYPMIYYATKFYLLHQKSPDETAMGNVTKSDFVKHLVELNKRDDAPAVEDALVAKSADSPMDWVGVLLAALFAALATLAVVLYRAGDRF
ncbi:conserved within P. aerophilum [Pyrobaculum aerophilum str. IM2]|uniref:Conserved within P. aerophilum n=2 Tax=Pyrobaculum aerophilum TaxID=13773 RepID=Q8ZWL6_PYRAE|nr:hypothetical protein [Pyrobaculum aerophilum]AAL63685.1 conserved within P. aerophilum [Pyrobaculum aerophilum str. IM2]HII46754.1 hypothetical protein [Pyrobaculum aerophilum]